MRSHCSPNTSSSPPTTTRSALIGTAVRAGPSAATITARASVAAATPVSDQRQLRVMPTASTIVSASTASTAQARNTETARPSSGPDTPLSMPPSVAGARAELDAELLSQPGIAVVAHVQCAAALGPAHPAQVEHAGGDRRAERPGEMMALL